MCLDHSSQSMVREWSGTARPCSAITNPKISHLYVPRLIPPIKKWSIANPDRWDQICSKEKQNLSWFPGDRFPQKLHLFESFSLVSFSYRSRTHLGSDGVESGETADLRTFCHGENFPREGRGIMMANSCEEVCFSVWLLPP